MNSVVPNSNERVFNLLLVDDDDVTNKVLALFLKHANFRIISAFSGVEALEILEREKIDLVLLDVMMPKMDGITALSHIRQNHDIPVLILTSISAKNVIKQAFLYGADDYIVKPFLPRQLLERIDILIKMIPPDNDLTTYSSGDLILNPHKRQFQQGKKTGNLSSIETRLLQYFIQNPNITISVKDLLLVGWSREKKYTEQDNEMLKLAIKHLREKIEPNITHPIYLPLVKGEGYIFHPNN
jgi:DNA-binding response OmpR family regulator